MRGDGEFIGKESIWACMDEGFTFTFGNKVCAPAYANDGWYSQGEYDYNETYFNPRSWNQPCRLSRCASGKISLATSN